MVCSSGKIEQSQENPFSSFGFDDAVPIPAGMRPEKFLENNGIVINMGESPREGGLGIVLPVQVGGESENSYVYKRQRTPLQILNPDSASSRELNNKYWRDGNIAFSRQSVPNFAKTKLFILTIEKPDGTSEEWCVPTNKTKDFGKALPRGTAVKLQSQIMERARGEELFEILNAPEYFGFASQDAFCEEHFNPIAKGLFDFLKVTFRRNLIHRDIKTENIFYEPSTKTVTVIDSGEGAVYAKRGKNVSKSGNPLKSSKSRVGTPFYMAPTVKTRNIKYEAEVDFYSAAQTLLFLLDGPGTQDAWDIFEQENELPTSIDQYKELLEDYEPVPPLLKALSDHPEEAATIDLFFKVASSAPQQREDAFRELQNHIERLQEHDQSGPAFATET